MKHMEGPWGSKQASSSPRIPGTAQRGHWGRWYMMQMDVNTGCSALHCWAHVQCIHWPRRCGACIFTQLRCKMMARVQALLTRKRTLS